MEIFFPGGSQPSWNITEIPGGWGGGVWQASPGMEILGGGGEWRSGPKTKVPCVGGMDIFWNYTLAAEDFYVPTLP